MDRSFLSQPEVVAASRRWVCIRLATYETAAEADVLRRIYAGPGGVLENTVFAMIAPDRSRYLCPSGRSPQWAFRDAAEMADFMNRTAETYSGSTPGGRDLPYVANVRLGLDVAACDRLPLVIVAARTPTARADLERRLAPVAWSPSVIGRAIYAHTADPASLTPLLGRPVAEGVVVVAPDAYGVSGCVLHVLPAAATPQQMAGAVADAPPTTLPAPEEIRSHIDAGMQHGIHSRTAIPVTDPQSPPDWAPDR